ncbi:MAG: hypothetical protein ACYTAN_18890 [Planctomycetota bacterium]|jgi:hypothetical protein
MDISDELIAEVKAMEDAREEERREEALKEEALALSRRIRRLEAARLVEEWADKEGVPGWTTGEAVYQLCKWLREERA